MKRSWIADLCLLFVALVWGSTFIIVQAAVQILPPLTFNAVRFLSAACLFLLYLLIKERSLKRLFQRKVLLHGGILGIVLFGGYALYNNNEYRLYYWIICCTRTLYHRLAEPYPFILADLDRCDYCSLRSILAHV